MQAKLTQMVGRPLESLTLAERWRLAGNWVALELYTPETLPLRIIEAIGANARDCMEQLRARGLDPTRFEYEPLPKPYAL